LIARFESIVCCLPEAGSRYNVCLVIVSVLSRITKKAVSGISLNSGKGIVLVPKKSIRFLG